jgi:predicted permease
LVLMVSAGLMIRTFQALRTVDPGFADAPHLQTVRIGISQTLVAEPKRVLRLQNDVLDKLASIPGVRSAGFISAMPMEGFQQNWDTLSAEGQTFAENELPPLRAFKYVSPGYFQAAGTKILAGRDLTWTDVNDLRHYALVSENLARELWGSPAAAIGKRMHEYTQSPWWEVAGVVADVRENGIQEKAPAIVYWPSIRENIFGPGPANVVRTMTFVIRSNRAGSEGFLKQVQDAVWSVNSNLALANVRTMQEVYEGSLARTSFTLVMLGIAGGMAMVLGIIGIYGVISYAVSQRRREIGIRLALGAQPGDLRRIFVKYGLGLAGIGVAVGLGASAGLMRLMKSLLFGISPLDPWTYAAVPIVLAAAAVLASYLPARRAAGVDPVEALRAE